MRYKETSNVETVNALLKAGWKVLRVEDKNGVLIFHLLLEEVNKQI